mgnify:CR=1 FL=1
MGLKWLLIPVLALAVVAGMLYIHQPSNSLPAELTFKVEVPDHLVAGEAADVKVYVVNHGRGEARDVKLIAKSEGFKVEEKTFSLRGGEERVFRVRLEALDVQDLTYNITFRLQYSTSGEQKYTEPIVKQIRILPAVEIVDVHWETDLFNLFGKSTIGRGDQTTLYFRVKSLSEKIIYSGIVARVTMPIKAPELKISPQEIPIEDLGPKGKTSEYQFKVISGETPPGQYPIVIQLYTEDGIAIPGAKETVRVTVSP